MSAVIMKVLWMYGLAAVVSAAIAGLIKVVVVLLGLLERRSAPTPAVAVAVTAATPPQAVDEGVPGPHLAAIAAAVHAVLGAHRIVHIEEARGGSGWTAEGRAAHHASHIRTTRLSSR